MTASLHFAESFADEAAFFKRFLGGFELTAGIGHLDRNVQLDLLNAIIKPCDDITFFNFDAFIDQQFGDCAGLVA